MSSDQDCVVTFQVVPTAPFRLDLTVWALRRGFANQLDRWDGTTYRRVIAYADLAYELSVRQEGTPDSSTLEVVVTANQACSELRLMATQELRRLLGLDVDLSDFYHLAAACTELAGLAQRFRGVKPPRFLDVFEALVNGILFQQVSLPAGITILNHLVEAHGSEVPGVVGHAVPLPRIVASLNLEELRSLGISRQKGRALTELAASLCDGMRLEQVEAMTDEEAVAFLRQFRGVGRWTAQYALLRGLGRLNVFPADDVGARNKVKNWLGLEQVPDYENMHDISLRWHPYAGMVYFHLLLNHLAEKGHVA